MGSFYVNHDLHVTSNDLSIIYTTNPTECPVECPQSARLGRLSTGTQQALGRHTQWTALGGHLPSTQWDCWSTDGETSTQWLKNSLTITIVNNG